MLDSAQLQSSPPPMPLIAYEIPRPGVQPRPVGPGRIERGYQRQVARLSRDLEELEALHWTTRKELETAQLVERGTTRYVDRLEADRAAEAAQGRRLLVLVGTLQEENRRLQQRVEMLEQRQHRLAAPPAPQAKERGLLRRLAFGW
ncbi:MAG: hypothetical protein R3F33_09675 [Planctomycetota bacterium]